MTKNSLDSRKHTNTEQEITKNYVFPLYGYHFDRLPIRLGGQGLGTLLFTWAYALVCSKNENLKMISATWRGLHIGPFLRMEKDKRFYGDLFISSGLSGLRKYFALFFLKNKVKFVEDINGFPPMVIKEHDFIKQKLLEMVRPKWLKDYKQFDGNCIGIHIRRGDFTKPRSEEQIRSRCYNLQIPLDYYISLIKKIRQIAQIDIPVVIFSDGEQEELKEILALPYVTRASATVSIVDILRISKCKLFIASGSTFSMWGSFLGQMPTLWHPGQYRQELMINADTFEGEVEKDAEMPLLLRKNIQEIFDLEKAHKRTTESAIVETV